MLSNLAFKFFYFTCDVETQFYTYLKNQEAVMSIPAFCN
jgi:hypothetical protein